MPESFVKEHIDDIREWYVENIRKTDIFMVKNPAINAITYQGEITITIRYNHLDKFKATHVLDSYLMDLSVLGASSLVIDGVSYIVKGEKTTGQFRQKAEYDVFEEEPTKTEKNKPRKRSQIKSIKKSSEVPKLSKIISVKFKVSLFNDNRVISDKRMYGYMPKVVGLYKYFFNIRGNLGNELNRLMNVMFQDDIITIKYVHNDDLYYTEDLVKENYILNQEGMNIDIDGEVYNIRTESIN